MAAAAIAADKMAEMIGDSGEVAVIVHDQTSRTGIDRRDGFLNEMKEKHPNIKIVSVQYGAGDHLKSAEIAKATSRRTRTSRASSAPTKARPKARRSASRNRARSSC